MTNQIYLDTDQALSYLQSKGLTFAKQTLIKHRWNRTGAKYIKIGRKVYYTQEFLDDWIDSLCNIIEPAKV